MGREMKTVGQAGPTLPPGAPRVRFAAPAGQPVAHFEISGSVALIGSRRDCDLFIGDGDVSKIHCALVNTGAAIIAIDLCTRSGTFVNGRRISSAMLVPGDELRVGMVPVDVRFLDGPDGVAKADATPTDASEVLPAALRLTGAEQRFELTRLPAVIGRRNVCHVVIDTPDVSLAHALLFAIDGRSAIFDLGSRSGTHLNGERVTLAWLRDGDRLCIGGEELSLTWEEAESARCKAGPAKAVELGFSGAGGDSRVPVKPNDCEDRKSSVAAPQAHRDGSQSGSRDRASMLNRREAELKAHAATLEKERAQLAVEKQRVERRMAELRTAMSQLEQERAGFQQARDQLEAQRAESERRQAELERKFGELKARELAFGQRQAALEAAEREIAEKQAELARREAVNADVMRQIEEFKSTLTDAQRAFTACQADPMQAAAGANSEVGSAGAGVPPGADLPAPLVNQPMFSGLDATSSEHWPPELRERLECLRRTSDKSEAHVLAQVLAEFQAQRAEEGISGGN